MNIDWIGKLRQRSVSLLSGLDLRKSPGALFMLFSLILLERDVLSNDLLNLLLNLRSFHFAFQVALVGFGQVD